MKRSKLTKNMYLSDSSAIHPQIKLFTAPALVSRGRWRLQSLHARPENLFFWVTRGQGQLRLGSTLRGFGPNTVLFIPAGQIHAVNMGPNTQGYIGFVPETLPLPVPASPCIIKATSIFDQGQLTGYFEQVSLEFNANKIGNDHVMESYLTLISVWIERNLDRNDWIGHSPKNAATRLTNAFLQRLEDNFTKSLSISTYAAVLDVTPTHLGRVCREVLGRPTSELVQERVVTAAKYALADSDIRINEIATDLGFSSPAYFTRLFKQVAGMSPRAFRQNADLRKRPEQKPLLRHVIQN